MEIATKNMTASEKESYAVQRMAHRNMEALCQAMKDTSVDTIRIFGEVHDGHGMIDQDMEWQYMFGVEEAALGAARVDIVVVERENGIPFLSEPTQHTIREAAQIVGADVMVAMQPDWGNSDGGGLDVTITSMGTADLRGRLNFEDNSFRVRNLMRSFDPMGPFDAVEPLLRTDQGDWYAVDSSEKAQAATHLGQTAVSHFYETYQEGMLKKDASESTKWYVLVTHGVDGSKAAVTMAAQKADAFEEGQFPGTSSITGYKNEPAHITFRDAIDMLVESEGLRVEMNHMGTRVEQPVDESMEP
jgi:hypothetical protein